MNPEDVKNRVANLSAALQAFEEGVAAEDVPLDVVSDFKATVDDLRLRLWGVLTARSQDDQLAFQHRFRLRRTREMCLQVDADLREGGVAVDHEELRRLAVAARNLAAAATEVMATEAPPPP